MSTLVNFVYWITCGCLWSTDLMGNDVRRELDKMVRRNHARRGRRPPSSAERLSHAAREEEAEELALMEHHKACGCVDKRRPEIDVMTFLQRSQTGDLVLFCGRGGNAEWTRKFTHSDITHVGMVWRPPTSPSRPLLLESSANLKVGTEFFSGVCGTPLCDRLYDALSGRYNSAYAAVYVRMIKGRLPLRNQPNPSYIVSTWSRKYRNSVDDLLMSVYDGPLGSLSQEGLTDKRAEFCSEYVADLYKTMKLLPNDIADSEYTPADLAWPSLTELLNGQTLGKHMRLTMTMDRINV